MADISQARAILGFEPKTTLEEGLRQTIDYYREVAERRMAKQS
jgi:dTDP-glucose 4,6-dehydratase